MFAKLNIQSCFTEIAMKILISNDDGYQAPGIIALFEAMKQIAADSTTQRWWRETDPCQQPLPEAAAEGKIWTSMEEVFHAE